jgi:hypothetical protein
MGRTDMGPSELDKLATAWQQAETTALYAEIDHSIAQSEEREATASARRAFTLREETQEAATDARYKYLDAIRQGHE